MGTSVTECRGIARRLLSDRLKLIVPKIVAEKKSYNEPKSDKANGMLLRITKDQATAYLQAMALLRGRYHVKEGSRVITHSPQFHSLVTHLMRESLKTASHMMRERRFASRGTSSVSESLASSAAEVLASGRK